MATAASAAGLPASPRMSPGTTIACAVSVLALPSAVLAFTASFATGVPQVAEQPELGGVGNDTPGMRLARGMPLESLGRGAAYPFTPARNPNRPDRSVTVAVRIDPQAMRALSGRGAAALAGADENGGNLPLAQSGFNLGLARGYRTFAPAIVPSSPARRADSPDLTRYANVANSAPQADPRFSSHIAGDERPLAGRTPRTFAGDKDDQVNVSGSYRLTRNLNVTAGVRYSQDRERLLPLTDGKQDSQAVYVGTQIRF